MEEKQIIVDVILEASWKNEKKNLRLPLFEGS